MPQGGESGGTPSWTGRIEECWKEREQVVDADGGIRSATVYYLVFDNEDEAGVMACALANVPGTITLGGRTVELDSIDIEERLTADIWKIAAQYTIIFEFIIKFINYFQNSFNH